MKREAGGDPLQHGVRPQQDWLHGAWMCRGAFVRCANKLVQRMDAVHRRRTITPSEGHMHTLTHQHATARCAVGHARLPRVIGRPGGGLYTATRILSLRCGRPFGGFRQGLAWQAVAHAIRWALGTCRQQKEGNDGPVALLPFGARRPPTIDTTRLKLLHAASKSLESLILSCAQPPSWSLRLARNRLFVRPSEGS